jgi:hypothetical protein
MMNRRVFFALALFLLPAFLGACAAGGAGAASGIDRQLLTLEDLRPYQSLDAYQVVRRLRGSWLNVRSTGSWGHPDSTVVARAGTEVQIKVYVDGVLQWEGVEALKALTVSDIREMRHLDARDATMQYGTDHGAGAILVFTISD